MRKWRNTLVRNHRCRLKPSDTYEDPSTGLRIRFDEAKPGEKGYARKNHYHILNPNATGSKDLYLDKDGNPVAKNSKASHILPKKGKKEK